MLSCSSDSEKEKKKEDESKVESSVVVSSWSADDKKKLLDVEDVTLTKGVKEEAFYLEKGDKLYVSFSSDSPMTLSFWNFGTSKIVTDYKSTKSVQDTIVIERSAIYYFKMNTLSDQQYDFSIQKSSISEEKFNVENSVEYEVEKGVSPKDPRAIKYEEINFTSLFKEPKKITLKGAFSTGSSTSLVALDLPKGTTELLYRMRLSSKDMVMQRDGHFESEVQDNYQRIFDIFSIKRIVLREILDRIDPPDSEEDCICDLYVFNDQKWARKFINGEVGWEQHYDVANSLPGTQSTYSDLKLNSKTLYFGMKSPNAFDSIYVWLEVIAVTRTVDYAKVIYKRK